MSLLEWALSKGTFGHTKKYKKCMSTEERHMKTHFKAPLESYPICQSSPRSQAQSQGWEYVLHLLQRHGNGMSVQFYLKGSKELDFIF